MESGNILSIITVLLTKLFGAAAGVAILWSVRPYPKTLKTLVSLGVTLLVSMVAAPITEELFLRWAKMPHSLETAFFAAALNGLFLIPAIMYIMNKLDKGELPVSLNKKTDGKAVDDPDAK